MIVKFGNHKLGDDTCIFNMGTATECPSKLLGLCTLTERGIRCYAEKAEIQYKEAVINYRKSQELEWKSKSGDQIARDITKAVQRRRKDTRYLRFNEAGDFYQQADVAKLDHISRCLRDIGVTTYGYTARSDLDFRGISFLCKGSGSNIDGLNGSTRVIVDGEAVPEGYIECPGSCKRCNLCKIAVPHNIAFRKH